VAAATSASALRQQFVDVVKRVSPSVVQIDTPDGLGSGVVFDDQGNIVTNAHVLGVATRFQVTASDNKTHPATLVGSSPQSDLAVIHVSDVALPAARWPIPPRSKSASWRWRSATHSGCDRR
jgi:S1-C subfamily serine protease